MSQIDDIIRERLRKLKGEEQSASSSITSQTKKVFEKIPKKSEVEQVEDLLKEISDETVLDDAYGKDKAEIDAQIRRRLERLKVWELGPPRASFKEVGRLKSMEDVVNVILQEQRDTQYQHMEDQDLGKLTTEDDESSSDDSDAPPDYCVFCKSNPSIVCIDCSNDSYCNKCFNEFHEPEDEHKTFKYVQKKKK